MRRRWSETHRHRRRTLARPVISVGNLSVGGTGKTPVVAAIAQWLIAQGEHPSILSRGYARAESPDGVVVVSDRSHVLESVERAGDEPLMLARKVPGAAVCVSPDRYLAGKFAEGTLGCTVHVLDDGFQHIQLERQLDVLVTTIGEIPNGRVLPYGRLREPVDAASRAQVLVVSGATAGAAASEAWTLGISKSCGVKRTVEEPVAIESGETGALRLRSGQVGSRAERVLAVSAIAVPDGFAEGLRAAHWNVVDTLSFPDHHRYSNADLETIRQRRQTSDSTAVFCTDKDAVKFESFGSIPFPLFRVPLTLEFDPPEALFDPIRAVLA